MLNGKPTVAPTGGSLFGDDSSLYGEDENMFVDDLFGHLGYFGQDTTQAPADPLAEANAPLITKARQRLAQFNQLRPLVDKLPQKSQREEAEAIVKKKWVSTGFLGLGSGKYNLDELSLRITSYLQAPTGQFIRIGKNYEVSQTRKEELDAFADGVKALAKYMGQFIVLPTEAQVVEVPYEVQVQVEKTTYRVPPWVYIVGVAAVVGAGAYVLLKK